MPAGAAPARELFARALHLHRGGDVHEASRLYREILALQPDHVDALHLLGAAALQQGRAAEALACFERVLARASSAPAGLHTNRGAALRELGRHAEALASLDAALAQRPDDAKALSNRAAALLDLGRATEARADVERALALDTHDAAAHHNHGNALLALGRACEALAAYDQALALAPGVAATHCNRGNAWAALGQPDAAAAAYEQALRCDPLHVAALLNRGQSLLDLGRDDAALASFARARELAPHTPLLLGQWLHAKLKCCDWSGLDAAFVELARGTDGGVALAAPFIALHAPLSLAQQRDCARSFARTRIAPSAAPFPPARRAPDGRLRIGYFSADFRTHPTARLAVGVFERHRRERFELSAFSIGPPVQGDAMRERLRRAFDRFVELPAGRDEDAAALARSLPIDIAVDLGGYTRHARPGIFAARAAPLQIGWLGYPGTLGAPWLDYLVADRTVVPDEHRAGYDERLIRLPHSYQPNDVLHELAAPPSRAELGLPDAGFVFCAFHQPAKITPAVFALWMRLLQGVPDSVLWLLAPGATAARNLYGAAAAHGIAPGRLVFAARVASSRHLERHAAADLYLDTWPYGAHTTASDALRAGVPLLTRIGEGFASRVAASLLVAVGLPELIAGSAADYERLALELARAPARLAALKERLAAQRLTAPLFDNERFTRGLEAALSVAWSRHLAGRPPADLQVLDDAGAELRVLEDDATAGQAAHGD